MRPAPVEVKPQRIDVEVSKVTLEVDLEPRTTGASGSIGGDDDQLDSDPLPAGSRHNHSVQNERMRGAVPRYIDEANQCAAFAGRRPCGAPKPPHRS